MMNAFTDNYIKNMAPNIGVYRRGRDLIDCVFDFTYDEEENEIEAFVSGSYDYEVKIQLNKNGTVKRYRCECEAYHSYDGPCKHIIAVMEYTKDYFEDEHSSQLDAILGQLGIFLHKDSSLSFRESGHQLKKESYLSFEDLGYQPSKKKNKVQLRVGQQILLANTRPFVNVQLKIGQDRLYVVKDIPDLLDAMHNGTPLAFGKKFVFEPASSYFDKVEQKILDFLQMVYQKEKRDGKYLNSSVGYYSFYQQNRSIFNKNSVMLFEDNLKRYLEIVKNAGIPISYENYENVDLKIEDDLEIQLRLSEKDDGIILEADYPKDIKIMPLTEDYEVVLSPQDGVIYKVHPEKARLLGKIHQIRFRKKEPVFRIEKDEQEKFIRGFYHKVKDYCTVNLEGELQEKLVDNTLTAKVFFDAVQKGISARVDFHYGQHVIDPLKIQDTGHESVALIMRNYEEEEKVLSLLASIGMKGHKEVFLLEDEEEIVQLLNGGMDALKDMAEVYYSDSFKNIQIRNVSQAQLGIRMNTDSSLLEFDFQMDDFDEQELHQLFHSIRQKKKYYRLKNGSFINLNQKELFDISELLSDLNVETKNLKNGKFQLPSNRALFIDNFVNERNMKGIRKNEKFEKLVQEIARPQDLQFQVDDSLKGVLREYQKVGYQWLKTLAHYGFGGILADDMGLGKTLQVLAFIKDELKTSQKPCLVVAPTSLVYNWQAEAEKFVPELHVNVVVGTKQERVKCMEDFDKSHIIVTSYGTLKKDVEMYSAKEFSYIFVDEAQHIKNPNTLNAGSVKSLKAKGYFALTGTPIENSLTELWSIFDFVMPGYLMNHTKFITKFEKPIVRDNNKDSLKTLSKFIKPFILRRLKSDVLKELPDKIESRIVCGMSTEQKKLYAAFLKKAQGEIAAEIEQNGIDRSKIKILAALTRLRQICCHPATFVEDYKGGSGKLETLLELLGDSIASGHRALIFSQFTSMHEIIGAELTKAGIPYFYLDGSTKAKDRMDMVNRFNNQEKPVFLISLKAGGTGLNLTGADMVIHFDPWWNPAVEDQATDRAYRMGQTKAVQVFKMISQGTIEEKIYQLQEKKRGLINSVIKPGENLLTKLGEKEIRELFQL